MRKDYRAIKQVSVPVALLLLLAGCMKDDCHRSYNIVTPVYEKLSALRAKVQGGVAQPLTNPGKLYISGNRIYLNERNKGIHVIDNSDPAHPKNSAFITVPGNIDIAMKGGMLYADMYCDLAVMDVSNPSTVTVNKYLTNTFRSLSGYSSTTRVDSINVITGWTSRDTVMSCESYNYYNLTQNCPNCMSFASPAASTPAAGTAGSMARFATTGNYLYAADHYDLNIVDITNAANPVAAKRISLNTDAETTYMFQNNLFIGSSIGMAIYDVQDAANPKALSWSGHWRICDPVIADGNYAFVTLFDGSTCGGTINELDLYSITNPSQPVLVKTYPLTNPHGLSKDGNLLFICDGHAGLKVFDAGSLPGLKLLKQVTGINTYDVIAINGIAYVVAKDGLYQYRYDNTGSLNFLSKLSWASTITNR